MNTRGLTLLEVIVIAAVIAILAALLLPAVTPGLGEGHRIGCANNLRRLYQLGNIHASTHPGEWPSLQDGGLWLSFTKSQPPLLAQDDLEVLLCPVKGEPKVGECDFRSPRLPFTSLAPRDIVAADLPGNHGEDQGGTVILKDGSVQEVGLRDELWKECARKLFP